MAVTRPRSPFLLCRSGRFYFRIRVPADIRERLGLVEVRRSLRPTRFHEARLLAVQLGMRVKEVFVMIRNASDLSSAETRKLVRDCFAGLHASADRPYLCATAQSDFELAEQDACSREYIDEMEAQIADRNFGDGIGNYLRNYLAARDIDLIGASPERTHELMEGFARALVEQQRLFLFRLGNSLAEYTPTDPLFRATVLPSSGDLGLTLDQLVEEYLQAKQKEWTPKTLATHRPKLKLLVNYLGADRMAETVTTPELWSFRDGVLRLRKNYHMQGSGTFQSYQTASEAGRISSTTAANILARTKALFRWGHQRAFLSANPAAVVAIDHPKAKKGKKSRRPFDADDLVTLFSSPLFKGCKSRHRRFDAGDQVIRDEYFWLPILGYYTGARLGELVQLHLSDCLIDHVVPHLSINEDGPESHGDPDFKHVKSEAGVRLVPLHPDLMAMGFADFVQFQRKFADKRKRLFFRIPYGADGQPSTVFSKWFARCLDKIGLDDPALCFHSFRHTAQDYFRSSQVPKYVIDQLIGHQDRSAAAEYGSGISLETASAITSKLLLPVHVPLILDNVE